MSFRDIMPSAKAPDSGARVALSAAAFAGAAYMGFRLARLVNFWTGSSNDAQSIDSKGAMQLSGALQHSANSPVVGVSDSKTVAALDLPSTASSYIAQLLPDVIGQPNSVFQRRLKQIARPTSPRPTMSLPGTPSGIYFPMNMPLDVGINMLLRSDESEARKAVMQIASPHVRQKMEVIRQTVKTIQRKVEREPDEAFEQVTTLDAKCLVQLLYRVQDMQDEELVTKLLTAIANCATVKDNQERLFEAHCDEVLCDLIRHEGTPLAVKSSAIQALSNLALSSDQSNRLSAAVPELLKLLESGTDERLRRNSLTALLNLALFKQNCDQFHDSDLGKCLSRLSSVEQSSRESSACQFVSSGRIRQERLLYMRLLANLSSHDAVANRLLSLPTADGPIHTIKQCVETYREECEFAPSDSQSYSKSELLRLLALLRNLMHATEAVHDAPRSEQPSDSLFGRLVESRHDVVERLLALRRTLTARSSPTDDDAEIIEHVDGIVLLLDAFDR